ncbi:hypothetical protein GCM10017581_038370 [Dactylosporangium matsuzakiense]|uniref:Uncharacterized protein n=1 Tax=Dactylosporangium matsuzakiense TaxID=53360 RepID=A0A9W6NLL9_9ACTN|nr:hypothetical protein GCM10017581_038370 [Dactylosporangium matsuzakiense]
MGAAALSCTRTARTRIRPNFSRRGTHWSLVNTWHTTWITDTSVNPAATIDVVYNRSYVVARDDVPNLR